MKQIKRYKVVKMQFKHRHAMVHTVTSMLQQISTRLRVAVMKVLVRTSSRWLLVGFSF